MNPTSIPIDKVIAEIRQWITTGGSGEWTVYWQDGEIRRIDEAVRKLPSDFA